MGELRYYLEILLDHQCSAANGSCRECRTLQRICQFMQTELFSTVIYTDTPLEPRKHLRPPSQPVNRAAVVPRRPHAA